MTEPTEQDLYSVDRLIDAAHREVDEFPEANITWYEDRDTGQRWTFDFDDVMRMANYAGRASDKNRALRAELAAAREELEHTLNLCCGWRVATCIFAAALLIHILLTWNGVRP